MREPDALLAHPEVAARIDLGKPLLLHAVGLFHLVADEDDPAGIVARFRDRMAAGSHIMISQFRTQGSDPAARAKLEEISVNSPSPMCFRGQAEILRFFAGFS